MRSHRKTLTLCFTLALATSTHEQTTAVQTRIGKLEFTHDFANGIPTKILAPGRSRRQCRRFH